MQSEVIKEVIKEANIEKYGCENVMQVKEFQEKSKKTNMERYGFDNPSKCEEVKDKITKTMSERHGVKYPMQLEEFKDNFKKSMLEKYGVEYTLQSNELKEKVIKTKIENGQYSGNVGEYEKYKNKVYVLTNLIRCELFDIWEGYDFYDNEYIKDNLNLCYSAGDYPTIDHKTSVLYGYINKISPEEIASIGNLCITKRSINSSKGSKNSDEFIK